MTDIDITKIKRLDGSLLLVFRELIRQRRTTVAGERLGLSQSAISHALARLRDLFDDPLFIRKPNGLEPTPRALELAPKVDELIRLTQAAIDAGKDFDAATTRRVFRIGAGDFMCALTAAPLLKVFEQKAPNASFSFKFLLGTAALDALRKNEIDLAVGRFPKSTPGILTEPLYTDEYCVIARTGHPRVGEQIDLDTFLELGHVLVSVSGDPIGLSEQPIDIGVARRIVASVPRFLTAFTIVAQTDAIATVSRRLAERHAQQMGFKILAAPFETKPFSLFIASIATNSVEPSGIDPAITWLRNELRNLY